MTRKIDFDIMAKTILDLGADIVGLNEIRSKGTAPEHENQTAILAQLTSLPYCFFAKAIDEGGAKPYGNAILSRYPIISAQAIPIPDPDPKQYNPGYYETRCLLKAVLENGVTVLICHFGLNPDEQENAVQTILPHLTEEKCILMGDFNTTPDSGILDPIFARMKDTAELFTAPKLSFPSDAPEVKIDYIFVSRDLRVTAADIPAITASDHRPYTATVTL